MIYAAGTSVREGRREAIEAVSTIAALIEPTLGPSGTDVLITTPFGEIFTTNDGATVMRELPIIHPAARIAADIALTQERAVGDGTTSAVVLAANLLKALEPLVKEHGIRSVLEGLERAHSAVRSIIEANARALTEADLWHIIETALCGKAGEAQSELIARLVIEAVPDADAHVSFVERAGEPMERSTRYDGLLIENLPVRHDMPTTLTNPRILILSGALEPQLPQDVSIGSAAEAERFFASEEDAAERIAERIIASSANLIVTRKGVDDRIAHALARAGIAVIRRVPLETLESLARASGGVIVPTVRPEVLGSAKRMRTIEGATLIEGFAPSVSTIVLCGATEHVAAELARAAHDAYGVIRAARTSGRGVGGALLIETLASRIDGSVVERAVASAFARLAEAISAQLPAPGFGRDARDGSQIDPWKRGIIEPVGVKLSAIDSAFEITRIIIRIETIVSLPEPRPNA